MRRLNDEGQNLGAYQAFGDILVHLGHDFSKVTAYRRELDVDRAVHQVTYEYDGVRYQHTTFASHPDGVIVIHLAANVRDYQFLFRRFSLDVGTTAPDLLAKTTLARLEDYAKNTTSDPNLEALFCQFGRYLMISCSRPGSLPANLQGVWNDSNKPAWAGDYHSNINVEMNYWPAEPANLAECHRPFIDYVKSIREVSAKNTRRKYGEVRGWTVQTMNNACGVSYWKWNPPGSAWYAQHLWEHFAFGRDLGYLRETAYPVLKEVCQFWDDRLKRRPDGTLVTPDGWSPEHGPAEEGVTYDQEIIYDLFTNTMEAADILGDDKEFRDHIAGLRDKLLKPKIGRWGQLQEWEADKDDPVDDHRHVSKSGLPCKVVCGDQRWEFNTKAGKSYHLTLENR